MNGWPGEPFKAIVSRLTMVRYRIVDSLPSTTEDFHARLSLVNGWPNDGLTRQKKTDDRIIDYEQT